MCFECALDVPLVSLRYASDLTHHSETKILGFEYPITFHAVLDLLDRALDEAILGLLDGLPVGSGSD